MKELFNTNSYEASLPLFSRMLGANILSCQRATYFFLEPLYDGSLSSMDGATEYSIGIGQSDCPDIKSAWSYPCISDAIWRLSWLGYVFKDTPLWLVLGAGRAQIQKFTVWEGVVHAVAEIFSANRHSDWVQISGGLKMANGNPDLFQHFMDRWTYDDERSEALTKILDNL